MKTLIVLAAMLTSSLALAGEYTVYGSIHFQKASTWVTANNVCQEDGYLYHKTKDYVVVECSGRDKMSGCEEVPRPLVQPMRSTKQICANYQGRGTCTETTTVAFNQGTVTSEVYSSFAAWSKGGSPIRTFRYTVDACGSAAKVPAN